MMSGFDAFSNKYCCLMVTKAGILARECENKTLGQEYLRSDLRARLLIQPILYL